MLKLACVLLVRLDHSQQSVVSVYSIDHSLSHAQISRARGLILVERQACSHQTNLPGPLVQFHVDACSNTECGGFWDQWGTADGASSRQHEHIVYLLQMLAFKTLVWSELRPWRRISNGCRRSMTSPCRSSKRTVQATHMLSECASPSQRRRWLTGERKETISCLSHAMKSGNASVAMPRIRVHVIHSKFTISQS